MFYLVGLGNPGEQYENTRHNTGRIILEAIWRGGKFGDWSFDKKFQAMVAEGRLDSKGVFLMMPETYMNKSGLAVGQIKGLKFKSQNKKKQVDNIVVIHDDLDIPFGKFKISFNKSSGGHKGVESVIKSLKTEAFLRIRAGICPITASGKIKKPLGEKAVGDFILNKFKPSELETMKKVSKNVSAAVFLLIKEGKEKAMGEWNSK